jgi:hypothetical protein
VGAVGAADQLGLRGSEARSLKGTSGRMGRSLLTMIKTIAAGIFGAILGCAATLGGTRHGIETAAATTTVFPRVGTKSDRTFVTTRVAAALCENEGKAGGVVTMSAATPVAVAPGTPVPEGFLMSFELRATCSGGPDGPLKSSAAVPSE